MPTMWLFLGFSAFFLWSLLRNYDKKSCLNNLKFWEASRNHKWSICWKFQLSISLGTQKESHCRHPYLRILFPFMNFGHCALPRLRPTTTSCAFIAHCSLRFLMDFWQKSEVGALQKWWTVYLPSSPLTYAILGFPKNSLAWSLFYLVKVLCYFNIA